MFVDMILVHYSLFETASLHAEQNYNNHLIKKDDWEKMISQLYNKLIVSMIFQAKM